MNTAVSLDSFQLIIGCYLLYIAVKGKGSFYNFFDLSEADQLRVRKPLRMIYGICALLAFADAGVCMAFSGTVLADYLSLALTTLLVLIFVGILIWLRRLARRK